VLIRLPTAVQKFKEDGTIVERTSVKPTVLHVDIISNNFWQQYPHVLT
jgi:hypothetical protein